MKLTMAARKKLPKKDFALPSQKPDSGSYPIPDKNHARAALSYVARFASPSQLATIKAKVKRKFNIGQDAIAHVVKNRKG